MRVCSSIGHGLTAAALGALFFPAERTRRLYALGAAGAVLLDLDAAGRPFGLGDIGWLGGHRAFTHSLAFAALAAAALVTAACRGPAGDGRRARLWLYFALALSSHGALDALTAYGEGVMFFAPFSAARYKAPWLPFRGIVPEVAAVWLPALLVMWWRRVHRPPAA